MTVGPTQSVATVQPQAASNPPVTTASLPESVAATQLAQTPISATPSPVQALATMIVSGAAARQDGIAPLLADLVALAQSGQPLPQPVVAAVRQLLGLPIDITGNTSLQAADIKAALMQSGLVAATPANVSMMATAAPSAMPAQLAGMNMVLGLLRRSLTNWANSEDSGTPQADPATARATPSAVDAPQAQRNPPPPPFRNGPTVAQQAAQPMLPAELSGPALARHLLAETEAVIARQTLLQVASLPDADPAAPKSGTDGRHLVFDVPLMTPQGMAVAQFRVEQDAPGRDGEAGKPAWRASFAIDVEPIGRVQAHIALVGGRTAVTLRAERAGSATLLNDNVAQLEASLREADLEPGTLACVTGAASAPAPAAPPGLFLDSTT